MANEFHWGPANPRPLSKMRAELVWEAKYDESGCDTSMTIELLVC